MTPLLLTPDQAAQALSVSRTTLYELMKSGTLPYIVLPGSHHRRIRIADVEKLIADAAKALETK